MNAEDIRYENDLKMYQDLLENKDVVRVGEYIEKMEEAGPMGTRRRLLSTSVRLSRTMAPQIHRMADECVERLGMEIPLELYVYSSPQFNAACFKPEDGQLFVMFSSGLLEAFSGNELKFVIGHEFGHHVYRHHEIPIGYLLRGNQRPDPRLALDLFSWSRNAEVSADRAGALCAEDFDGVARALFKLASGLGDSVIKFSLDEFLQQVDEMKLEDDEPGRGAPKEDWFSTHPFSPLRVHALKLFHESELMDTGGGNKLQLEMGVHRLMSLMEPSYLDRQTDTAIAMQRCLFAGAIAIANADGEISKEEIEVFEKFLGKGEFSDTLNIDKVIEALPERIAKMKEVATQTQSMQVLRDLCVMARANGHTTKQERKVLDDTARQLEVSAAFICEALEQTLEPD